MLTDDVEYTNGTNKGGGLLFIDKLRAVPQRTEGHLKVTRGTGEQLYIDQHILNGSKTRRKSIVMVCIDDKNSLWHDPS